MNTSFAAMKRGRTILFAALAAAGLTAMTVHAAASSDATPQAFGGHQRQHCGRGARFMHVLKRLDLSPEQQTQIEGIFASAVPQFQELRTSIRANHEALAAAAPTDAGYPALLATEKTNAAKRIDQMSSLKTQIYAVLTPIQIKQIPQIIAADKAKWQQRDGDATSATSTHATSS